MARPRSVSDDDILEATGRVVAREGVLRFTLAQVGEEAGLSAPALVQRFGGKRQLLLALSERSRREPVDALARARAKHASPLDALAHGLADALAPMETPGQVARSLEYLALDIADPEFHVHAVAFFEALRGEVARALAEAIAARELRAVDVDALARAVEVAFNGSIVTWAVHGEGSLPEAVRRDVAAVVAPYRRKARGP